MSALAIHTALLAATASPVGHAHTGESGSGFSFADALTGFDKSLSGEKSQKSDSAEQVDVSASAVSVAAAAQTSAADATDPTQALAAALAAFASSGAQAQDGSYASAATSQSSGTTSSGGTRVRLPLGPLAISAAAAAPGSTIFSPIEASGADALPAVFDLTGAVPLQRQLSADPTLGFQSLQARTHLAVTDALPIRIRPDATSGAEGGASGQAAQSTRSNTASIAGTSNVTTALAPVSVSSSGQSQNAGLASNPDVTAGAYRSGGASRTIIGATGSRGTTAAVARSHPGTSVSVNQPGTAPTRWSEPDAFSAGANGGQSSSGRMAWGGRAVPSTTSSVPALNPDSTIVAGATDTLSDSASTSLSLSPSKLPDFVAEQAAELSAEASTSSAATASTATTARAPQAVKELDIELNPGDLGAVKLQMRLVNGKLSVVISVENPKTLATIEGERDAIASRLGGSQQELEDLTIRQQLDLAQGSNANESSGNSNSDSGQSNAQSEQSGRRSANGSSARSELGSGGSGNGSGSSASFNDFVV